MLTFYSFHLFFSIFIFPSTNTISNDKEPFRYEYIETVVNFEKHNDKIVAVYTTAIKIEALDASNLKFVKRIPIDDRSYIENVYNKTKSNKTKLNIVISDVEQSGIFHSDLKMGFLEHEFKEKGEKVKFEYTVVYTDLRFLPPVYLQHEYECKKAEAVFLTSKKVDFELKSYNLDPNIIQDSEGEKVITVIDQTSYSDEEGVPAINYYAPHIFVIPQKINVDAICDYVSSTDDLYKYYKSFATEADTDTSSVAIQAKELVKGSTSEDQLKSILYWVQNNIRYIAFEYDLMGFIPEHPSTVYANKYGDCKGMANLIKKILVDLGYDARLVWIGTHSKSYDYTLPSFYVDNHMICAVITDTDTVYLDGTEDYADYKVYANRIAGRPVLIENGDNYILSNVPEIIHTEHSNTVTADITIDEEILNFSGLLEIKGNYYTRIKQIYHSTGNENQDWLVDNIVKSHEDETVEILNNNIFQRDTIGYITYQSKVKNNIIKLKDQIFFHPDNNGILFDFELKTDRTIPYQFSRIHNSEKVYNITIPNNYEVEYMPDPINIKNDYMEIEIAFAKSQDGLTYRKLFKTYERIMPPSSFEQWNEAHRKMESFFDDQIILAKK